MDDRIVALGRAAEIGAEYLRRIDDRTVFPDMRSQRYLEQLERPLADKGAPLEDSLEVLANIVGPATVASAGRRYFGFVIGGTLPSAMGADVLLSAFDNCASSYDGSPGMHAMETVAGRWVKELLGLPDTAATGFPTCTTTGEMALLAAARRRLLLNQGWDEAKNGLFGAPPIRVIVSGEVHATMFKVLSLLGIGPAMVEQVPVDDQGRMRQDCLPDLDDSCLLCLQAGNVNSGAFDPFADIIPRARAAGAWVHIDGAFGLWAAACSGLAHLTTGMEDADSWIVDGHKYLNTPYDGAISICRDGDLLAEAMGVTAAYLPESNMVPAKDRVLEFSRRARGVPVWAALHGLGKQGLSDLIWHCHQMAVRFRDGLQQADIKVLNTVSLNQVVFAVGDAPRRDRFLKAIEQDGTCWFGPTEWQNNPGCRLSVSSWRTTEADVDASLDAILRINRQTA